VPYGLLADAVVALHFAFVAFVVAGGLLVIRWPRLAWVHVPAAVWGAVIEFAGWICPLTPLENHFRRLAGHAGYEGGFVDRYVVAALYPQGLTRSHQIALGVLVLVVNAIAYTVVVRRRRQGRGRETPAAPGQPSRPPASTN
jgi:hypothetical protein